MSVGQLKKNLERKKPLMETITISLFCLSELELKATLEILTTSSTELEDCIR
jgi:hypothetical protein